MSRQDPLQEVGRLGYCEGGNASGVPPSTTVALTPVKTVDQIAPTACNKASKACGRILEGG